MIEESSDRPFDRCWKEGCRKAPAEAVSVEFLDGKPQAFALSYCSPHAKYAVELFRSVAVVPIKVERVPLA